MSNFDQAQPPANQKNWFARNWWWVIGLALLLPVTCCGLPITAIVLTTTSMMKANGAYVDSLDMVRNDTRIQNVLGTPIEDGFFTNGNLSINGSSGSADISYGISGPDGSGDVHVVATLTGGSWSFDVVEVKTDDGQTFDLLVPALPAP